MRQRMTHHETGIRLPEGMYPHVPDGDNVNSANVLFGFAFEQTKALIRSLNLLTQLAEKASPQSAGHTKELKKSVEGAFLMWHMTWPE